MNSSEPVCFIPRIFNPLILEYDGCSSDEEGGWVCKSKNALPVNRVFFHVLSSASCKASDFDGTLGLKTQFTMIEM